MNIRKNIWLLALLLGALLSSTSAFAQIERGPKNYEYGPISKRLFFDLEGAIAMNDAMVATVQANYYTIGGLYFGGGVYYGQLLARPEDAPEETPTVLTKQFGGAITLGYTIHRDQKLNYEVAITPLAGEGMYIMPSVGVHYNVHPHLGLKARLVLLHNSLGASVGIRF